MSLMMFYLLLVWSRESRCRVWFEGDFMEFIIVLDVVRIRLYLFLLWLDIDERMIM